MCRRCGPNRWEAGRGGRLTEALTNAAKHGHATRVVVFADVDESTGGLFLTIKDDGCGFAPATVAEGMGMAHSIRGRVEDLGGRVAFVSAGGDGTEVRISLPLMSKRRAVLVAEGPTYTVVIADDHSDGVRRYPQRPDTAAGGGGRGR